MGIHIGLGLPSGGRWGTAENIYALAELAEKLGYASVWTFHHLLYPLHPLDPFPPRPDEPMPAAGRDAVDPFVALAAVAARTSRIRLGVGGIVAPYYASPLMLAKQAATLDMLSGGRLDLGLVPGWSRDEFAGAGIPHEERAARMDEILASLPAILESEVVSTKGRDFLINEAIVGPRPVQSPIPLIIGGYSEATIRRIVQFGHGYVAGYMPFDQWPRWIDRVSRRMEDAGRDPATLRYVCRATVDLRETTLRERRPLQGNPDQIRADLVCYEEFGVTDLFIDLNFDPYVSEGAASPKEAYLRAEQVARALAPVQ
ncbi:TIGR03619 family F420-dependent LLM class oxidoreductase [Streptomyces sp. NPDC057271]|uniref:TIGR03619 family F420-dependent LLM class oxidoreductase n=1 Tax=unclassified Streptomyces TaxID=2593676 RepID=UPI0036349998